MAISIYFLCCGCDILFRCLVVSQWRVGLLFLLVPSYLVILFLLLALHALFCSSAACSELIWRLPISTIAIYLRIYDVDIIAKWFRQIKIDKGITITRIFYTNLNTSDQFIYLTLYLNESDALMLSIAFVCVITDFSYIAIHHYMCVIAISILPLYRYDRDEWYCSKGTFV